MVAARAQFLMAGHFAPLADAAVGLAAVYAPSHGLLLEIGAGTGYYLAHCLDQFAHRLGLAVDASKHAAGRAARAHPRMDAIVADVWNTFPLASGSVGLALDIFAPRNAAELRRTLRHDGALLVVTPERSHLNDVGGHINRVFGLLQVDPRKQDRLVRSLGRYFRCCEQQAFVWRMSLARDDLAALGAMLPSARHQDPLDLSERIAKLSAPLPVTGAVTLQVYRPARK